MSIGGPHEVLPPHGGPTSASEAGFLRSEAN